MLLIYLNTHIYFILKASIRFVDQILSLLLFTAITVLVPYAEFCPSGKVMRANSTLQVQREKSQNYESENLHRNHCTTALLSF